VLALVDGLDPRLAGGRLMKKPTKPTCMHQGLAHTWESRGWTGHTGRGARVFACTTCGAWGWAHPWKPREIRQYRKPFERPMGLPRPEPTVLTQQQRGASADPLEQRWIDRRGDLLPRRSGKTWYTPRYGLGDAERVPAGGRRVRRAADVWG
jgi:hypothetical protein